MILAARFTVHTVALAVYTNRFLHTYSWMVSYDVFIISGQTMHKLPIGHVQHLYTLILLYTLTSYATTNYRGVGSGAAGGTAAPLIKI